ncbi:MAG: Hsp20/alpha crystallin family protein [Chloroflexi bacterium]|nr:Hsp20/alpha crystallin family protein [Chloroflexota bacterium]
MRVLTRWEPFAGITSTRRLIDRVFDDTFFRPYRLGSSQLDGTYLPLDVAQTRDEVVIKASLPGLKPQDVQVSLDGNVLTIRGETGASQDTEDESYVLRERRQGAFHRSLTLPKGLVTDKVEARFEDGVLTLTIPKAEESKPRTIEVKGVLELEGKKT